MVKIIKIRHLKGHISQKYHDLKIIFKQNYSLQCCRACTKFLSSCYVIFIFSCIFCSRLWRTFLRNTLYHYNSARVSLARTHAPSEDPKWWNGGEPIWVTGRRQGLTTATMFWPGSDKEIRGMRPSHWFEYDGKITFEQRVNQSLNWLEEGE